MAIRNRLNHEMNIDINKQLLVCEAELQIAKQAASLANYKKSSFLFSVSHKIRGSIVGILALLEQLRLSKLDKNQKDTLISAYESGNALLRVIDDILNFSRLEDEKLETASTHAFVGDKTNKSTLEPINRAQLAEIFGDNQVAQKSVLMDFQHVIDRNALMLVNAIKNNDMHQTLSFARNIKDACHLIGADMLGNVCQYIENAGANGDRAKVDQFLIIFQQDVANLKTWFDTINKDS